MKKTVCVLLILAVAVYAGATLAQGLGDSFGSLGEGIANAAKTFGSHIADASAEMYESVKDAFVENGPEIADGVSEWIDETTPKVTGFFAGLWDKIKTAVN